MLNRHPIRVVFACVLACAIILGCHAAQEPPTLNAPETPVMPTESPKRGAAYHFCGWGFEQSPKDLEAMYPGLSWYYNWSSRPMACPDGSGVGNHPLLTSGRVEFVPMAWGLVDDGEACETGGLCFRVDERLGGARCQAICAENGWSFHADKPCYQCYHEGISREAFLQDVPDNARYLLGYNEPNFKEQANLTPAVAAKNWKHLEWVAMHKDLKLVGPATNFCDPTPGAHHAGACIEAVDGDRMFGFAWLERFYDACSKEGIAGIDCQIDYQAIHAYSCHGITWVVEMMKRKAGLSRPEAAHCNNGVQDEDEFGIDCGGNVCTACSARARTIFAKPVWLTEFATPSNDCGTNDPDALQQKTLDMMAHDLPRLEADPYVFRYAWFMPKVSMESLDHTDLLIQEEAGVLSPLGHYYFGRE